MARAELVARLEERTADPDEHGCRPWLGAKTGNRHGRGGYATIRVGNRTRYAHRLRVQLRELVPAGYEVDHQCCDRACQADEYLRAMS